MNLNEAREVIKSNYPPVNYSMLREALDWLLVQAELAEHYGKKAGELNVFLQERVSGRAGDNVIDVVMEYVEQLENKAH